MITDAGNVPVDGGRRIAPGLVFRISGALARTDELGVLEAAGLRRIVDMRAEDEDRSVIMNWARAHGVEYQLEAIPAAHRADFTAAARDITTREDAIALMTDVYRWIVEVHGGRIAATIGALAEDLPAGYGCAAGKDRTGIVTAFLHVLLGVSEEEASRRYIDGAPTLESLSPLARNYLDLAESDPLPLATATMLEPLPAAVDAALRYAHEEFGGVTAYLEHHGLTPETVAVLRERLLIDD